MEHGAGTLLPHLLIGFHSQERQNYEKETDSIEQETNTFPDISDKNARNGWPHQPCAIEHKGVQGNGVAEVILIFHHVDYE